MLFCPFCFRVPLLKLSIRKKGTLIIKGLLRNLDDDGVADDDGSGDAAEAVDLIRTIFVDDVKMM